MRDFDLMKAKEMFLNYLKWREEYRVDLINKVKSEFSEKQQSYAFYETQIILIIFTTFCRSLVLMSTVK